jgi:pyridoxal 5'-phosphate synthase pdxS subunit
MIRTKGEAGTGNVVEAVRHLKAVNRGLAELRDLSGAALAAKAEEYRVPLELLETTKALGRLSVVTFVAGGIATPADAALMMMMGSEGCFVGSGIFKSQNPARTAKAVVEAVINWKDPAKLVEISRGLGEPMKGLEIKTLETAMAARGL